MSSDWMKQQFEKAKVSNGGGSGWALTALTIGLFLVTGYRTAHYIWGTLPAEWWFISVAGVLAFDGGAILWARAWESNSSNGQQDTIAQAMFVVDVLGMFTTSLVDSVDPGILPAQVSEGAMIVIPTIIVLNVVAGIVYRMVSDHVVLSRESRHANARMALLRQQAAQEQEMMDQQESVLQRRERIAEQQMRLDATERALQRVQNRGDHVEQAAENIAERVRSHFSEHRDMSRSDDHNGNGNGNGKVGAHPL